MGTLFLAWQDAETRRWFPIGRLTKEGDVFHFAYINGVTEAMRKSGFQPLTSFPDIETVYRSTTLFPLFANRVMPHSRPDYPNYVKWLNIGANDKDPMTFLANSGGRRATDTLEIFPMPTPMPDGGHYLHFFVHGLRHMHPSCTERAERLIPGERLLLQWDMQNPYDPDAFCLRTANPDSGDAALIGYMPRYLGVELRDSLRSDPKSCKVEVTAVNPSPAPVQLRLMCRIEFSPDAPLHPFSTDIFQPVTAARPYMEQ